MRGMPVRSALIFVSVEVALFMEKELGSINFGLSVGSLQAFTALHRPVGDI